MSKNIRYYRCKNRYDEANPCEHTLSGRIFAESELISSIDGNPKCPGKTRDGNPCDEELVLMPPGYKPPGEKGKIPWRKLAPIGGGVAAVLLLVILAYIFLVSHGTPILRLAPGPVVFPQTKGGAVTSDIRLHNDGDGELLIDNAEVRPAAFSVEQGQLSVAPKGDGKLSIRFVSPSTEMMEGELVLHSNDKKSPTHTIKLIANRDPWWVFRKLESTSKILQKEP